MLIALHGVQRIREDRLLSWLVGGLIFLATLVVWLAWEARHPAVALVTFMPAITIAALAAGWRVATLITLASALTAWWLLLRQPGAVALPGSDEVFGLALFAASGAVIVAVVELLAAAAWPGAEAAAPIVAARDAATGAGAASRVTTYLDATAALAAPPAAADTRLDVVRIVARHLADGDDFPRRLTAICADVARALGRPDIAVSLDVDGTGLTGERRIILSVLVAHVLARLLSARGDPETPRRFTVTLRHLGGRSCALDLAGDARLAGAARDAGPDTACAWVPRALARLLDATVTNIAQPSPAIRVTFPR